MFDIQLFAIKYACGRVCKHNELSQIQACGGGGYGVSAMLDAHTESGA